MADELGSASLELLRRADPAADFVRRAVERLAQEIIEVDVERRIGAARYQRSGTRNNSRNGARLREWDTPAGRVHLRIPKLRHGSFLPGLLEPRRRADRALAHVVAEAYVVGVSPRQVGDLAQAVGFRDLDPSTVSRLASVLEAEVGAFRERPLPAPCPHLWLDATFPRLRADGRVATVTLMIAAAVTEQGRRTVLGLDLGRTEDGTHWRAFLRSLRGRGLHGVSLVSGDEHPGLRPAVEAELPGSTWQRSA